MEFVQFHPIGIYKLGILISEAATDDRLEKIDTDDGIWGCKTMWWCRDVCPKGIPITKCLGRIKRVLKQKEKSK